ncbi:MAG: ABC transporter permease [Candidatus Riflebacteria bacterium]|nr:ABC transporter permease [Candidatus Riflebacteria bacterium]
MNLPDSLRTFVHREQCDILTERYLDIIVGDWRNTLLLLSQSPVIAGLIILRWHGTAPTPTLHFILCLAATWFGCINASREIVKERSIFLRERNVNLEIPAYVLSKVRVLASLGFIQCLTMLFMVHYYVGLAGSKTLLLGTLFLASFAGTALGLLISSLVDTTDRAVGLVPVFILPQILFSKFVLQAELLKGIPGMFEKLMITVHAYDMFEAVQGLGGKFGWLDAAGDAMALLVMSVAFILASMALLRSREL